ncbi:hypothetical protein BDV06DRAFT_204660 [Aspergillus oleicola]
MLLSCGAKVDDRDLSGETPLLYTARLHLHGVAHILLEQGARIDASDNKGRTPLLHAVYIDLVNYRAIQRLFFSYSILEE